MRKRSFFWHIGSAMTSAESIAGLKDLGIIHATTLPYSPYQNGKQEVFWASVEGRLLAMLEGVPELTLALLNEATQAWVELEYNQKRHAELGEAPLARYLRGPDVGRDSPDSAALRRAFRRRLGVAPRDCLVFEDTEMGIQAATAAGMASVKIASPLERSAQAIPNTN